MEVHAAMVAAFFVVFFSDAGGWQLMGSYGIVCEELRQKAVPEKLRQGTS